MVVRNSTGRNIGDWNEKKNLFVKQVYASKHLFKKFNAWGIDGSFFTNVLLPKNATIEVRDKENGIVYQAKAEVFQKHDLWFHFKSGTLDHESQIFLPLDLWTYKTSR